MGPDLVRDAETYAVIGAAMAVHRELGHGFLEGVYQEAMGMEMGDRGVPYAAQVELPVRFKGRVLKTRYRADFLCSEGVVVEIKAVGHDLTGTDMAQLINYLKATGLRRGLLINFGRPSLKFERIVMSAAGVAERSTE